MAALFPVSARNSSNTAILDSGTLHECRGSRAAATGSSGSPVNILDHIWLRVQQGFPNSPMLITNGYWRTDFWNILKLMAGG